VTAAVRMRPLLQAERRHSGAELDWVANEPTVGALVDRRGEQVWHFDYVAGPRTSTEELFEDFVADAITAFRDGINVAVMAYGQTASGKSFTMSGQSPQSPGLVQLAANAVFTALQEEPDALYTMAISYVEIYCEQAYDLLKDNTVGTEDPRHCAAHSCLHSRDLPELRSLVCREVRHGARDLLACLEEGSRRRKIGETRLNERSSRGHSILRLSLEMQSGDGVRVSTLDFVDLAGSEGIHVENAGRLPQAPEDATHVSIGAFSKVLLSLAARTRPTEDLYASSLLTRMLREALGGNTLDVARLHGLTCCPG